MKFTIALLALMFTLVTSAANAINGEYRFDGHQWCWVMLSIPTPAEEAVGGGAWKGRQLPCFRNRPTPAGINAWMAAHGIPNKLAEPSSPAPAFSGPPPGMNEPAPPQASQSKSSGMKEPPPWHAVDPPQASQGAQGLATAFGILVVLLAMVGMTIFMWWLRLWIFGFLVRFGVKNARRGWDSGASLQGQANADAFHAQHNIDMLGPSTDYVSAQRMKDELQFDR